MAVWGVAIIGNLFVNPPSVEIEYKLTPPEIPQIIEVVEAKEETIPEKIKRLAGNNAEMLLILAEAESNFDTEAKSKTSSAKGLFQILNGTWKEYECTGDSFNAEDNINCAVKIYEKEEWRPWVASFAKWKDKVDPKLANEIPILCSCMKGLMAQGIKLKGNAIDLVPNSTPIKGGVVKLIYNGVGHAAKIIKFTKTGMIVKETNYSRCKWTTREIAFNDPAVAGFLIP